MNTNETTDPTAERLLRLVPLCDSALPIGGSTHSWGLEATIARGRVTGPEELESWTRAWLASPVAPGDGLIIARAACAATTEDWDALAELNEFVMARALWPEVNAERSPGDQQDRP